MKLEKINLIKKKKFLKIMAFLSILGMVLGFLIYKNIDNTKVLKEIKNIDVLLNKPINLIFIHFIFLASFITCSVLGLGIIIFTLYFIIEIAAISYNFFIFSKVFGVNGAFFSLIYTLIIKGLYIIFLLVIFKHMVYLTKKIIKIIMNKNSLDKEMIGVNLKMIALNIVLIMINDILVYIFANDLLLKLSFILN